MVPPVLTYLGMSRTDILLAHEVVRQCCLYYDVLKTESECWKHTVNARGVDERRVGLIACDMILYVETNEPPPE